MQVTLNAKAMSDALSILKMSIAAKHKTIPILGHVLISVQNGIASFSTTDLDNAVTWTVDAGADAADGACTVPHKALVDALKGLKGSVKLESLSGFRLTVAHASGESVLQTQSADDYPCLRAAPAMDLTLDVVRFRAALDATAYAASCDETRYELNGVFMDADNTVATDGRRLVRMQGATGFVGDGSILPSKGLAILSKVIAKAPGVLQASGVVENFHTFSVGAFTVSMRAVAGQFPNYQRVIPKLQDKGATFDRALLLDVLKRCDRKQYALVKITFTPDAPAKFSQVSPDRTETSTQVACTASHDLEIGLNAAYFLESIEESTSGDTVTIRMTDPLSPILITSGMVGTVCVVMPMRL